MKFKIPAQNSIMLWAGILNFKFKLVFLEYFFSRFGDLKNESHFLKKASFRERLLKIEEKKIKKMFLVICTWTDEM